MADLPHRIILVLLIALAAAHPAAMAQPALREAAEPVNPERPVIERRVPGRSTADLQAEPVHPERRMIEQLILQIREGAGTEPLRAAELFDTAWELSVRREDPLVDLRTEAQDVLQPGEHRTDAGSRAQLQNLYEAASPAFCEAYQEWTAEAAKTAIQRAVEGNNTEEITKTILRYQFTSAGQNALSALVRLKLSRGENLQAALQFGRLMRLRKDTQVANRFRLALLWWNAGLPEEAIDQLEILRTEHAGENIAVGGHRFTLPAADTDISQWMKSLADDENGAVAVPQTSGWNQPLGNYRRTLLQQTVPTAIRQSWKDSTFACVWNSELESLLAPVAISVQQDAAVELQNNNAIVPAAVPLLAGDLLIYRGVANIRAVNRLTGELVWETSFVDSELQGVLRSADVASEEGADGVAALQAMLRRPLLNHLTRSNAAGQLTSDGKRLYAVEEVTAETMRVDWDQSLVGARRAVNYLRVYDLASGQVVGILGGSVGLAADDIAPNPLKGFYTLGAPLVLGERIYLMAENDQGIFLLQLNPDQLDQVNPPFRREPIHSQLLSVPRFSLREHPVRMYSGVTPSFGDGLLICNTCDEKVVAVSAEDHSVRWVYRYPGSVMTPELSPDGAVLGNAISRFESDAIDMATRWQDALPRIVGNRVVLTPRDSDRLVCLELQTGRELWTRPRGNLRRIVHIDSQQIVLTGTDSVECVATTDGSSLWTSVLEQGRVSGAGISDGRLVHIPTSAPEIVSIDIATGRTLLSQPIRDSVPGNLISDVGRLYSQSLTSIECYETPAEKSTSPLAIAARQMLDGNITAGEQTLRTLLSDSADADNEDQIRGRRLLINSILESLQTDFRGNADRVPEVQTLIADSVPNDHRIVALTQTMLGMTPVDLLRIPPLLEQIGDSRRLTERLHNLMARHQLEDPDDPPQVVADHILQLLDQASDGRDGFSEVGSLKHRSFRVTAASIREALHVRGHESAVQISNIVQPKLMQRIADATSPEDRLWWSEMCLLSKLYPPALAAVLHSNTELPAPNQTALRSIVSMAALPLAGDPDSAEWLSEMLDALWNQNQQTLVADMLSRNSALNGPANRVQEIPFTGQPGESLLWPAGLLNSEQETLWRQKIAKLPDNRPWQGTPTVTESEARSVGGGRTQIINTAGDAIPVFGASGAFPGWAIIQNQGSNGFQAYDASGRQRWLFEPENFLPQSMSRFGMQYNSLSDQYAVAWGTLLAVKTRHMLYVLDCSQANTEQPPQLLWELNLMSAIPPTTRTQQMSRAWQRTTQYDIQPTGLFPIGPITPFGLPVYSGRTLLVCNPLTGERQWRLNGLPEDCTLTAADDRLLIMSEAAGTVETRSLIDGRLLQTTTLPNWWTDASENSNASIRDFEVEPGEELRWRLAVQHDQCLTLKRTTTTSALESLNLSTGTASWSLPLPQDSVVSNIVDGNIAVLSDGNRLQILNLITGTRLCDLEVPVAAGSRYLHLRPAADNWIVLTDVWDQEHDEQIWVSATTSVQVNGHIYAVAKASGQLSWTQPVQHRFLRILNPQQSPFPPVMPLLILLQQPYQRDANGFPRGATVQAKILNTVDGTVLYEDEDLGRSLSYHSVRLNNDENSIDINFDKRSITFQYKTSLP